MSGDWLKKWYRESYSQSSPEPIKEDTWEKIEEKINDWSGYWYASNAEKLEVTPEPGIWGNISAGIEQSLILRKSLRYFWMRTIGASLIFVLFPYLLSDFQTESFASYSPQNTALLAGVTSSSSNEHLQTAEINSNTTPTNPVSPASTVQDNSGNIQESSVQLATTQENSVATEEIAHATSPAVSEEQPTISANQFDISRLPLNSLSQIEVNPGLASLLERKENKPLRNRLWNVGLATSFQYSTLYNPTTQKGYNYKSSIKNIMGSSVSVDISAGRRISNHGFIQATLALNDKKSQRFMDFVGSEYMEKSLSMTYQTLHLSYHHSLFAKKLRGRLGVELSSGLYASYRTDIDETWGNEDRTVLRDGFSKFDFGGKIGLDGVYAFRPAIDFKLGLFYTNGFINVFNGVDDMPAHFYKSFTSSFGSTLGVRYNF